VVKEPHRGDVWWGEVSGVGRRPYLVVTREGAIPVLTRVVCAPISRTVRDIPTELPLGPDDGMPVDCAASFDNLLTVPKSALASLITSLRLARQIEMCGVLRTALQC
jgi:mRNA interferase MazF